MLPGGKQRKQLSSQAEKPFSAGMGTQLSPEEGCPEAGGQGKCLGKSDTNTGMTLKAFKDDAKFCSGNSVYSINYCETSVTA